MKIYLASILLGMFCVSAFAQKSTLCIKVTDAAQQMPLLGATVQLKNTSYADISNKNGDVFFKEIEAKTYLLEVTFIGYKTYSQKITVTAKEQQLKISLQPNNEVLESILITASRSSRTIQDIPTRIEFVSGEELSEKAMMNAANVSMVLRESNGIQMQQTSLSSGNMSVKIQGLDGRYTQLLKDGFPLYGGFSGGLSWMQIPPLDLAQVEIIKGSASTLYGGGAIAGLVHMVSKTPQEKPELEVLLTQTHVGGSTANVFYSYRTKKIGYTLYGVGNYQKVYDSNQDDFSNIPQTKTFSFHPKLFYYPNKSTQVWVGLNATKEERIGGDVQAVKGNEDTFHAYQEINTSNRNSLQAVVTHQISKNQSITAKQSVSSFDREITTTNIAFSGNQTDVFSEISYQSQSAQQDWVLGANYYQNAFRENPSSGNRNQNNQTLGVFAKSIYNFTNKWMVELGLRTDYTLDYGTFLLPRVSVLWKKSPKLTTRVGGGLGYKTPSIFTEEAEEIFYQNVQAIPKNTLKSETSYGINWDVNYRTKWSAIRISWNQLIYVTAIKNALVLQEAHKMLGYVNANNYIVSRGAETNIKCKYKDLKWYLSYSYNHTSLNYLPKNPQKTLTPKHMAGSVFMYENDTWRVGLETYYTGKQKLNTGATTTDYVLFGFLIQKHFSWGSPFVNIENFTDVRQSKFSSQVLGTHSNPQFQQIYAPTDGFVATIGIKFDVFRTELSH